MSSLRNMVKEVVYTLGLLGGGATFAADCRVFKCRRCIRCRGIARLGPRPVFKPPAGQTRSCEDSYSPFLCLETEPQQRSVTVARRVGGQVAVVAPVMYCNLAFFEALLFISARISHSFLVGCVACLLKRFRQLCTRLSIRVAVVVIVISKKVHPPFSEVIYLKLPQKRG
jgi:hypothetical protein